MISDFNLELNQRYKIISYFKIGSYNEVLSFVKSVLLVNSYTYCQIHILLLPHMHPLFLNSF